MAPCGTEAKRAASSEGAASPERCGAWPTLRDVARALTWGLRLDDGRTSPAGQSQRPAPVVVVLKPRSRGVRLSPWDLSPGGGSRDGSVMIQEPTSTHGRSTGIRRAAWLMAALALAAVMGAAAWPGDVEMRPDGQAREAKLEGVSASEQLVPIPVNRTPTPPTSGEMVIRISHAPDMSQPWLECKVFRHSISDLGQASSHPVSDAMAYLGLEAVARAEVVYTEALATPAGCSETRISSLPVGDYMVLLSQLGDSRQGLEESPGLLTQTSGPHLIGIGRVDVDFDFSTLWRLDIGVSAANRDVETLVATQLDATGFQLLSRDSQLHVSRDGTAAVLGSGRVTLTFLGRASGRVDVQLVAVANNAIAVPISGSGHVQLTAGELRGDLVLVRDGLPQSAPFRYGPTFANLGSLRQVHSNVSLANLKAEGWEFICIQQSGRASFRVPLHSLRHESDGKILVQAPDSHFGTIHLDVEGDVPGALAVVAECSLPGLGVFRGDRSDRGWRIEGLPAASYDLYWVETSSHPRRAAIARNVQLAASDDLRLNVALPSFKVVEIEVRNSDALLREAELSYLKVGDAKCVSTGERGRFRGELPVPLTTKSTIRGYSEFVAGSFAATGAWIDGDVLVVDLELPNITQVAPEPLFGGHIDVGWYAKHTATLGGDVMLAQLVKSTSRGVYSVHASSEGPELCFVTESDPATGGARLRGFFTSTDTTTGLRGRWIEAEWEGPGVASMTAVAIIGEREAWYRLADLTPGCTRIWMPESVEWVRTSTTARVFKYAHAEIGDRLRLF